MARLGDDGLRLAQVAGEDPAADRRDVEVPLSRREEQRGEEGLGPFDPVGRLGQRRSGARRAAEGVGHGHGVIEVLGTDHRRPAQPGHPPRERDRPGRVEEEDPARTGSGGRPCFSTSVLVEVETIAAGRVEDGRDDERRGLARAGRPDDQGGRLGPGVEGGDGQEALGGRRVVGSFADVAAPPGPARGSLGHQRGSGDAGVLARRLTARVPRRCLRSAGTSMSLPPIPGNGRLSSRQRTFS